MNRPRAWRPVVRALAAAAAILASSCAHTRPLPQMLPAAPAGQATAATNAPVTAFPPEYFLPYTPTEYRLAIGDQVEISIFGHSDTTATTPVAPDGKLYYMFVEGIPAAGRRPEDVARDIQSRIAGLFNNPRVDILPKTFVAKRYLVLGKVVRPGTYPLDAALTVRQAIANAGGLAQGTYRGTTIEIAALKESYLLRDGRRVPVDFERLVNANDPGQDIYVRPGDVVYIASGLSQQREVYLLGAVSEQKAVAYRDNMTIVELIAGASERGGGYLPAAHLRRVVVLRGALSEPQTYDVDFNAIITGRAPDQYLAPGDIVYVPEKPYRFARDLSKMVVLTFVRAFASEAGASIVSENFFPTSTATPKTVTSGAGTATTPSNPELDKLMNTP